ncbi:hypothetical protein KXV74_001251 [Aspergillus fumigatus]|nr:hypothetical protein KXX57_007717 [Aspergillus fumigatus]KAH2169718.1 hypothetical protein KXV74_001251 [Aspergillus fumigatus]KAH2668851.1 hypothetical protein KXV32_004627 [Aspergillus fumigatus]KAH2913191.1 hypothetical protein KXW25_001239 [Aspergillus fumigatus]KAH3142173.1 hypothetical protein KXW18_001207 [Aspergillus fumigatus]
MSTATRPEAESPSDSSPRKATTWAYSSSTLSTHPTAAEPGPPCGSLTHTTGRSTGKSTSSKPQTELQKATWSTLHTDKGCSVKGRRKQLGSAQYSTCDDKHGNAGCAVQARPATYGQELNEDGGAIYAVELREAGIRVWGFPRDSIPDDISSMERRPDPSSWGPALADFPSTHCDIPSHFSNQSIIVNIDLCGEMGAQREEYNDLYGCPATCQEFVARNAQNLSQAYWEFRSFRIYQTM